MKRLATVPQGQAATVHLPKASFASRANPSKGGPNTYDLVKRKIDKAVKQAPLIKQELDKQIPRFKMLEASMSASAMSTERRQPIVPPDRVLKSIDTSFESFFYQRAYTERNFCFYMQACAQQYKPDDALKAFERMLSLGIKPTDHIYT